MPLGKYNAFWGERAPLVSRDEWRRERAAAVLDLEGLTFAECSAMYLHELLGCDGLEFVLFTNGHVDVPMHLSNGAVIVPCFLPTLDASMDLDDPVTQATVRMHQRGRFVYDGWLPIFSWNMPGLRARIQEIDEVLSAVSLVDSIWYSWEPKYFPWATVDPCYYLPAPNIETMDRIVQFARSFPAEDSDALFRSMGWLSQSYKLRQPTARFLFCILCIEALATHIERHAADDSPFAPARASCASRSERKAEREQCIQGTLDAYLGSNPTRAVQSAYFECVIPIGRLLKEHLDHVFAHERESREVLFDTPPGGKSLWDLRHVIAHGTADALSHAEREAISSLVPVAEKIARRYLRRVLELATQETVVTAALTQGIWQSTRDGLMTTADLYRGPTKMASLYG